MPSLTGLNKIKLWISLLTITGIGAGASSAHAGILDKLNAAAQKMQTANQNIGQKKSPPPDEDPDKPLPLEDYYTGSCEGKRSATCMDYMELADQCMDPLRGYRAKLLADLIEKKLKKEKDLSPALRKNLEEDLVGLREAHKNKTDDPTIAGQPKSQRYLQDITEEDQVCVNADFNTFYKKIYNKCIGADHMGIGKRTEMMQDTETMTCEQAIAEHRKKLAKEEAPFECLKNVSNVRWVVMAEHMERKMAKLNPSGKERADWEADIASVREVAAIGGTAQPKAVDPSNPVRYMMRLIGEEQVAMMQEYSARSQEESAKCMAMAGNGRVKEAPIKSGGLVDQSKSPANKNAKPTPQKKDRGARTTYSDDGSLSAHLGATKVDAMIEYADCSNYMKGGFAKLHADKLQSKLDAAGNVPSQKRKEWEEDIAAWREAQMSNRNTPEPPDPDNPYRWYDYVSNQERQQINQQYAAMVNDMNKKCNPDDPLGVKKNNLQTRYGVDVGKPKPKPKSKS